MFEAASIYLDFQEAYWTSTAPIILLLFALVVTMVFGLRPLIGDIKRDTGNLPSFLEKIIRIESEIARIPSISDKVAIIEAILRRNIAFEKGELEGPIMDLDPTLILPKSGLTVTINVKKRLLMYTLIELLFVDPIPSEAIMHASLETSNLLISYSSHSVNFSVMEDDPRKVGRRVSNFLDALDERVIGLESWEQDFENELTKGKID